MSEETDQLWEDAKDGAADARIALDELYNASGTDRDRTAILQVLDAVEKLESVIGEKKELLHSDRHNWIV